MLNCAVTIQTCQSTTHCSGYATIISCGGDTNWPICRSFFQIRWFTGVMIKKQVVCLVLILLYYFLRRICFVHDVVCALIFIGVLLRTYLCIVCVHMFCKKRVENKFSILSKSSLYEFLWNHIKELSKLKTRFRNPLEKKS